MKTLAKITILGLALFLVGCVHPRGHISSGIYDVSVSASIPLHSYGTHYDHDVYINRPMVHDYDHKPRRRHYKKHYNRHYKRHHKKHYNRHSKRHHTKHYNRQGGYDRHNRRHKTSDKAYRPRHNRREQHYAQRGTVDSYASGTRRKRNKHSEGSSGRRSGARNGNKGRERNAGRRDSNKGRQR